MEEEIKDIKKDIKDIKDNHLVHLYTRLGRVEGKLYVLVGIGIATVISIWLR